jgi:hypothetical protein
MGAFGNTYQTMPRTYPLDRARTWRTDTATAMHGVGTPRRMTLAQRDHFRFVVIGDMIVRSPWPPATIRKRLVDCGKGAVLELVQIAAGYLVMRGHLGYMVPTEQSEDSPHTLRILGRY